MKLAVVFCFGLTFLFSGDKHLIDPSKFPVPPHSKRTLFYIHRSTNANTVIYEANLLDGSLIDPKDPVNVYWMRYGERGQQRSLNYIEKSFAYGVKSKALSSTRFNIEFVASKDKKFEVFVDETGQACAVMNIGGKLSRLRKIFVQVAEDGWWPRIDYVEFISNELETNKHAYEKKDIE
jgi:hypothetical protein